MKKKNSRSTKIAFAIVGILAIGTVVALVPREREPVPPYSDDGVPLPFTDEFTSDIQASVQTIGRKSNIAIRQIAFDNDEVAEVLQGTTFTKSTDFVLTSESAGISSRAPMCLAMTPGKKYFGYKYTSRAATKEKASAAAAAAGAPKNFKELFEGEFFASAEQRAADNFIAAYEAQKEITFKDPCDVTLEKNARYLIVVNDASTSFTARGLQWCGNGNASDTGEECDDGNDVCGDGIQQGEEGCDDRNTTNNDGCSAQCHIESGYNCNGSPSVCTATGETCPTTTKLCGDICIPEPFCCSNSDCSNSTVEGVAANICANQVSKLPGIPDAGGTCVADSRTAWQQIGDVGNKAFDGYAFDIQSSLFASPMKVWVGTNKNIVSIPDTDVQTLYYTREDCSACTVISGMRINNFPNRERVAQTIQSGENEVDKTYVYIQSLRTGVTYRALVTYTSKYVENDQVLSDAYKELDALDKRVDGKIDMNLSYRYIGIKYNNHNNDFRRTITLQKVFLNNLSSDEQLIYKAFRVLDEPVMNIDLKNKFPDAFAAVFDSENIALTNIDFRNSFVYGNVLYKSKFDFNNDGVVNDKDNNIFNRALELLGYSSCITSPTCENGQNQEVVKACIDIPEQSDVSGINVVKLREALYPKYISGGGLEPVTFFDKNTRRLFVAAEGGSSLADVKPGKFFELDPQTYEVKQTLVLPAQAESPRWVSVSNNQAFVYTQALNIRNQRIAPAGLIVQIDLLTWSVKGSVGNVTPEPTRYSYGNVGHPMTLEPPIIDQDNLFTIKYGAKNTSDGNIVPIIPEILRFDISGVIAQKNKLLFTPYACVRGWTGQCSSYRKPEFITFNASTHKAYFNVNNYVGGYDGLPDFRSVKKAMVNVLDTGLSGSLSYYSQEDYAKLSNSANVCQSNSGQVVPNLQAALHSVPIS